MDTSAGVADAVERALETLREAQIAATAPRRASGRWQPGDGPSLGVPFRLAGPEISSLLRSVRQRYPEAGRE